jgi:transposase
MDASREQDALLRWESLHSDESYKRLERGHFTAPWSGQSEMTESELQLLLEGAELVGRMPLSPRRVGYSDRQVVFR